MSRRLFAAALAIGLLGAVRPAAACDACATAFNSKRQHAAGPTIVTPTAATLGKGRGSAGFLFEHQRYNTIPADDAHDLHHDGRDIHGKNHEEFYNVSAGYGVTDDLDLFVVAPVVSRSSIEIHEHETLGQRERATGFGDMKFAGRFRFYRRGADAAALVSVKAPTGETSDRNQDGEKFEAEQQPGSGSWDFGTGLAVSRSFRERLTLASAFQYAYRGEGAQGRKLGDVYRLDLGGSWALRPLGTHPNLHLVLELHNQWARRDHSRESDEVLDSGGTTMLVSPGLSADFTESLSAFVAMPVPVYQNLGGEHEELTYEVITGASWHF